MDEEEEEKMTECPECGETVSLEGDECPNCGYDISEIRVEKEFDKIMDMIDDDTYKVKDADSNSLVDKIKGLAPKEQVVESPKGEGEDEVVVYECPLCGAEVAEDEDECPSCGAIFKT